MGILKGYTKDKSEWIPRFVESLDKNSCIGCGRCYKACPRGCLHPQEFEDEETDTINIIMQIVDDKNCIGCCSCSIACPKGCFTHVTVEA